MCLWDGKYYRTVNVRTGVLKSYKRAASIARRFESSTDWVNLCASKGYLVSEPRSGGDMYRIEGGDHIECGRLRRKIIKYYGSSHRFSQLSPRSMEHFRTEIAVIEAPEWH